MSKLFQITENDATQNITYDANLHRLYTDRLSLGAVTDIALYAAITSALLLDLISIFLVLLPFRDNSVYLALKHFAETADERLVQHIYAQLMFTATLFVAVPISLVYKRLFVWQALQSWNLVGVALQLASLPYIRTRCIFSIISRFTLALCIKAQIADLTFTRTAKEEQLKAPS